MRPVTRFRIRQAANLLGVSDDTVRRWADTGRLATVTDESGRRAVESTNVVVEIPGP